MRVRWCRTIGTVVVWSAFASCAHGGGAITGEPPVSIVGSSGISVTTVVVGTNPENPVAAPTVTDLVADFHRTMTERVECGRRPGECRPDELAVAGSPLHSELSALMESRAAAGISASRRGSLRYRIDDSRVADGVGVVRTCLTDDTVLTMDGAVFDESVYSAVIEWTLVWTETGWKWSEWRVVTSSNEEDLCGLAG